MEAYQLEKNKQSIKKLKNVQKNYIFCIYNCY